MRSTLFYSSLDSTMLEYARVSATGSKTDRFVIQAAVQTGGFGRAGNSWLSPEGGLWLTSDLINPISVPSFALYIGYCLHSLLFRLYALNDLTIKWPNDIYLGTAKLAGILCEYKPEEHRYIIGIGINTNFNSSVELIEYNGASLCESIGYTVSNTYLLKLLMHTIESNTAQLSAPQTYIDYSNSCLFGKESLAVATSNGKSQKGIIKGIFQDGSLMLADIEGNEHLVCHGSLKILCT